MVTCLKKDGYRPRIFIKNTLNFGDRSAPTYLEIVCLRHICGQAKLEATRQLLTNHRFSDNPATSYKTTEEYYKVKRDMEQAFKKFNMRLKYVLGRLDLTPDEKGEIQDTVVPLFGLLWDREKDEIQSNLKLNLFGYRRGRKMGKDLMETEG